MAFYPSRGRVHGRRGLPMPPPHAPPISPEVGEKTVRDYLSAELRRQNGINEPSYSSESYNGAPAPKAPYGDSSIVVPNPVITAHNNNTSAPPLAATTVSAPVTGFEDTELYFDSFTANGTSNFSGGELLWDIAPINNLNDIKNCVQLNIGDFYFPKIYGTTGLPEFFYYRRVYAEVMSVTATQGVLGLNGMRYHFEFEVENLTSQAVHLVPVKSTFFFQQPITSLSAFQIRFMVPSTIPLAPQFKKIPIPPVNVTIAVVLPGTNPIQMTIVGYGSTPIAPVGAITAPGVAIIISGINLGAGFPAANTALNNPEGVFVTNVNDVNKFEIAGIDATGALAAASAPAIILKNRIAFPVRFTTVKDRPTNFVTAAHL